MADAGAQHGAQNIYDDARFFAGYSKLRETGAGLNDVLEQPALHRLLPPLVGWRVLDLGCGMGQFARYCREQGARRVLGVDVSEKMLEVARQQTADPGITYRRADLETLDGLPDQGFELVVSSLTLHYVVDYAGLLRRIAGWLAPGGVLAFSIEHPLTTANKPNGWVRDAQGNALHWALDRYGDEGPRQETWFVEGVEKRHRTLATLVNGVLAAGLVVDALGEPAALQEAVAARPSLAQEARRPPFLLVRAHKPQTADAAGEARG